MKPAKELDIHVRSDSALAHKAAVCARDLVEAARMGPSTLMLTLNGALDSFNAGPEEARLEGLAYILTCLSALVLRSAEVGDVAETLRQCRATNFTF
jgi:hypothetical protein